MTVIDAHLHVWQLARGDYGWLSPADGALYRDFTLADAVDAAGPAVDGMIVVQAAPTLQESLYLLELARRYPIIRGVVGWIDFESSQWRRDLAMLAARGPLVGIRPMLQDIPDPDWILRPDFAPILDALAEAGLVFDALVRLHQLPRIAELADRHPGLRIVIDHGGKPQVGSPDGLGPWRDRIAACADRPNMACKLSGLLTELSPGSDAEAIAPCVDQMLAAFGRDRLLWGSDWPVVTTAAGHAEWLAMARRHIARAAGDDRAVSDAVFGDTACRIYRLPERRNPS